MKLRRLRTLKRDADQTSLQPLKVRKNVPALQLPADNYLPSFIILGTWKTDFAISTKLISSSSAICPRPAAGRTSGFQHASKATCTNRSP